MLERKGIFPYIHQCEAIRAVRAGEDIILSTSTASGKTLAFSLPIFEHMCDDPDATALYLYPTKALSRDQLKSMVLMEKETGISLHPAIYDGDTPQDKRPAIREHSRVVLSNPYELHQILPWHHLWTRFFKNLGFVVIDEAHLYRGVFGSHVAFLIRRLQRVCAHYGADPRFIIATATLANPETFAERLTGRHMHLISKDGAPHGEKQFVLYNPFFDGPGTRSMHRETATLLRACMRHDLQTICFTGSRKLTELVALWTKDELMKDNPGALNEIAAYRAGYLQEERREIEDRLKTGSLKGVVSTNALELGIDVGSLDAVILSGYPGTMISTWQQSGRAGRSMTESLSILVARADPLEQYFMRHPEVFFQASHEHAVVDLANPYILSGQVLCAASELPIDPERDRIFLGDSLEAVIEAHAAQHLLSRTKRGWMYTGHRKPGELVSLGNISQETFRVLCKGHLLETLDRAQAYREAHEGAVMIHQGTQYLVKKMDLTDHIVRVDPADLDYYTKPLKTVDVELTRVIRHRIAHGIVLSFADVIVTEQYTGYKMIHHDNVIGVESLSLPPIRFPTKAIHFRVPEGPVSAVNSAGLDLAGGLHAVEHAFIATMPFHVMCDRWDIGGLSMEVDPESGDPAIFVYDGFEGGIGLSESAYDLFEPILAMTRDLVGECRCEKGCPACIYSPKCGNDNQPLDKAAAITLLEALSGEMQDGLGSFRKG
jgi:DEAD/DEAH box helicase domain-containing protein